MDARPALYLEPALTDCFAGRGKKELSKPTYLLSRLLRCVKR